MSIYVNNGPIVFPQSGGTQYVSIEIDGNVRVDGKKVVEWKEVRSNQSWITIEYDEEQYDNGYYYSFDVTATASNYANERIAIIYFSYVLEDGTTKTESVYVYQTGWADIRIDAENPLVMGAGRYGNPDYYIVTYGTTDASSISNVTDSAYFSIAPKSSWDNGKYNIEYAIAPKIYNVENLPKYDSVVFSYLNSSSSFKEAYTLRMTLEGCYYPFGIVNDDGSDIPTEQYMAQPAYKRLRNIPFTANKIRLRCFYPYAVENSISFRVDNRTGDEDATVELVGREYLGEAYGRYGVEEGYEISFKENFSQYTGRYDFIVSYTTMDGKQHTDTVQMFQNATDGSNVEPQVYLGVTKIKVKSDGTPDMASNANLRVQWIGDYIQKDVFSDADWITIGNPLLIEQSGNYNITYEYPLTFKSNDSDEIRNAIIYCDGVLKDISTVRQTVEIIQSRVNKEDIILPDIPVEGGDYCGPIWKDIEYNFGGVDDVNYKIYITEWVNLGNVGFYQDNLIFSGKSCKRPNAISNKILVNKICQNYLNSPMFAKEASAARGGYNVFKLTDEGGSTVYKTYRFVNDWSYSDDFKTGLLSHPILNDRTVVSSQMLPFTVFGAAENVRLPYGIIYKDGHTDDYGEPVEDWSNYVDIKDGVITELFPFKRGGEGVEKYYIGDTEWKVVDDCKVEYVLYYVNPWGGYDWFPIKGKAVEIDDITQYIYTQNYTNTSWDFGKRRYLSEINKKYQLHTHWLKGDESKRMWYLLQSNTVYLHNVKENKISPVIITATQQEHKQRGIVSSRISYQIDVELSQMRERM